MPEQLLNDASIDLPGNLEYPGHQVFFSISYAQEDFVKKLLLFAFLFAPSAVFSQEPIRLGSETTVVFATVDEARQILGARDDFVRRMSPFDRAARMKTDKSVSEKQYLGFVRENVQAWTEPETRRVTAVLRDIQTALEPRSLPFPKKVFMIKTTGAEEGRAPYTRGAAVVLPAGELSASPAKLRKTICHELFHVLSRANPDLRERLYAAIGFDKCSEVPLPSALKPRKITNPDAPCNDHCIRIQIAGTEHWAVPILFSSTPKYDTKRGGEFFNYLQFQLLIVKRTGTSPAVKPVYDGRAPKLVDPRQVSGFFEQVGRNTQYIIHPEEILADNFALVILNQRSVPSPEILTKLEGILKEATTAGAK